MEEGEGGKRDREREGESMRMPVHIQRAAKKKSKKGECIGMQLTCRQSRRRERGRR